MTVAMDLVKDSDRFFELCEQCVGSNFMRVPLSFKRTDNKFVSNFPSWFEPKKPTTMAEWLCFFIERVIWIQFKANVEQQTQESTSRANYRGMTNPANSASAS